MDTLQARLESARELIAELRQHLAERDERIAKLEARLRAAEYLLNNKDEEEVHGP